MKLKAAGLVLALVGALVAGVPTVGASTAYGPVSGAGTICNGQAATIIVQESGVVTTGTDGDDVIIGTFGPDTIDGGAGHDTICGHSGDDVINGGPGNDHIQGGNSEDIVNGGAGNDVLFGGNGDDEVNGQSGTDIVLGERGNDTLIGDPAVDTIYPGPGNDEIIEAAPVAPPGVDAPADPAPGDDAPAPTFDPSAPLNTDQRARLDPGVALFETGGTPFNIEFPEGWELIFNSEVLAAFTTDFDPLVGPENDLLVKRGNALGNPAEAGTFIDEQDAPFDVRDLDAWIAAVPQEIFSVAPSSTTFAGRDAVTFQVRIEDVSLCGDGPACFTFTGNVSAFDSYSFEPNVDYTVWVVDMGEFDPQFVLLADNGESPVFSEQALDVANSIVFDEPQPNPLPLVEAPWEIGGIGFVPPGVVEWPLAGGVAVDIPEESVTGQSNPGLFFLTQGLLRQPAELQVFTPVSDPLGNPIETTADFIAAGEVIDFTATEVGTAETRLGTATVVDIVGGDFDPFPPVDALTSANFGIITEEGAQFGWGAPTFARAWIIESDRGLIVLSASVFGLEREALDEFIDYAESVLPSLRFVDEPDGALPQLATDVGFEVVVAGDYILNFDPSNPVLTQTTEDAVLVPAGPDLIAVEPPALAIPDGPPVGIAFLDVNEVFTSNDGGDTAPVPDDLGAFFAADDRLTIEDTGTLTVSGVEARWWDLAAAPGAGLPEGEGCAFGNCVPIFVNQTAGGTIVIADNFEFRVFEIPDPDGTVYAIAQAPAETNDELLEFADGVLAGIEVLPVPVIPDFDEGDLFGIEGGATLPPGSYFSNDAFSVPFQLELTEERRFGIATETLIGIQAADFAFSDDFSGVGIIEPTSGLAAPDAIGGPDGPPASFIEIPSDLTSWVEAIPEIELRGSGSRDIGGIESNFVDIAVIGAPERNGDCGGTACFTLFNFGLGPFLAIEGSPQRIYVVELPETTILINVEAPEAEFDGFVADSQIVLDGISFG